MSQGGLICAARFQETDFECGGSFFGNVRRGASAQTRLFWRRGDDSRWVSVVTKRFTKTNTSRATQRRFGKSANAWWKLQSPLNVAFCPRPLQSSCFSHSTPKVASSRVQLWVNSFAKRMRQKSRRRWNCSSSSRATLSKCFATQIAPQKLWQLKFFA